MKRTTLIITSTVILGLVLYYFNNIYGWMEFRKSTNTPKQFLNKTLNTKEDYAKDRLVILHELKSLLLRHEEFFYSEEYFDGTDIVIDTIVYNPDFNKLAILFLTKNPTSRQLMPIENKDYYYNATAYLGLRQGDTIKLSWLGPNFTNSTDKSELSKDIREACFRTFVSKDTTEKYAYKYNINDIRFWTSSVWQKFSKTK